MKCLCVLLCVFVSTCTVVYVFVFEKNYRNSWKIKCNVCKEKEMNVPPCLVTFGLMCVHLLNFCSLMLIVDVLLMCFLIVDFDDENEEGKCESHWTELVKFHLVTKRTNVDWDRRVRRCVPLDVFCVESCYFPTGLALHHD